MSGIKFTSSHKKRTNKLNHSHQSNLEECHAVGKFENGHVAVNESPAKYYLYFFGGYFGTPIHNGLPLYKFKFDHFESVSESENSNHEKADCDRKELSNFITDGYLQLCLEEAFYLSYFHGILGIEIENKFCNLSEIWALFCNCDCNFVSRYVAYHYFRAKNWVIRILYKEGPPHYHASYVVKIHEIRRNSEDDEKPAFNRWNEFTGLNRVVNQVVKELIVCYVVWPPGIPEKDIYESPQYFDKFQVHEILSKRWVPSEGRENEEDEF
ncbi:tRNA-splicing endonuclease subunit Sen2 [Nymphon striatum]|nr:tRNA-splicing endonuclease subunit Sen2 [Nymphon striatum]